VPAVTELVVAQLMYLEWMNRKDPVYIYINSTGTARDDGEPVSELNQLMSCAQVFFSFFIKHLFDTVLC
jgi:ATP-dependent protease ClpP protease subunit